MLFAAARRARLRHHAAVALTPRGRADTGLAAAAATLHDARPPADVLR